MARTPHSHSIGEEIYGVLMFVGAVWVAFFLAWLTRTVFSYDVNHAFGLTPRTLSGLIGVVAMPFLHAGPDHLAGNTVPLLVLLMLLAGSRARSWEIVATIVLLGGGLLWLLGPGGRPHVGASGLVFGLIAFLLVSGALERRFVPLVISVLVAFLYGGTLVWGVLPTAGEDVSWQGHLFGALAGTVVAIGLTREPKQREPITG